MNFKDFLKESAITPEKILGSKASLRTKDKDAWIETAQKMGLKVKSPSVDPNGEHNTDFFLVAFDKFGNMIGVWYKKEGIFKD